MQMQIEISEIKKRGNPSLDVTFDFVPPEDFVTLPSGRINDLVKVYITALLQADVVYVDLKVCCTIVGECARCLDEVKFDFEAEDSVRFVRFNPEDEDYQYSSGVIDLTKAVRDMFILYSPSILLCKDDCKGLCPICGCNRNISECDCEK